MFTQSQLKEILHYDTNTGIFTWKKATGKRVVIGNAAGWYDAEGYKVITINKKKYKAHRLAFVFMGEELPKQVDHINHIKDDNRWSNLRASNNTLNAKNVPIRANNTSGFLGVTKSKTKNKWIAQLTCNGTSIYLGTFETKKDANLARLEANKKYGFHENHGL